MKQEFAFAVALVLFSLPFLLSKWKGVKRKTTKKQLGSYIRDIAIECGYTSEQISSISEIATKIDSETKELPKGFWIGKIIQIFKSSSEKETILIKELLKIVFSPNSSVSPYVRKMIEIAPNSSILKPESLLIADGTLDWSKFTKEQLLGFSKHLLDSLVGEKANLSLSEAEEYLISSTYIKEAAVAIHSYFETLTLEQFTNKYKHCFPIFHEPNIFHELFVLHKEKSLGMCSSLLVYLRLISHLDNALGDVLYVVTKGKKLVPKKLRLTLATPELQNGIGANGKTIVNLITCFTGPLQSMNIRNLLWHGFLHPSEFEPCYTSFLFMIILSLEEAKKLLESGKRRKLTDIREFTPILSIFGPPILFDEFSIEDKKSVESLFQSNFFVIPGHQEYWMRSLDLFVQKEYINCLSLLLPQLEHSLRRIFVCVNNCSDMLWTAEHDNLYSTVDILLSTSLPEKPDLKNHLYDELTEGQLDALLDVFIWFEGPKIRDQISHGAVDIKSISTELIQRILALSISLCKSFEIPSDKKDEIKKSKVIDQSVNFIGNYQSCFHLKSHLQREMIEAHREYQRIIQNLLQYDSSQVTTTLKDAPFDFDAAEATVTLKLQELKDAFHKKFKFSSLCETTNISDWLSKKVRTYMCSNDELAHFLPALRGLINSVGEFTLLLEAEFQKISDQVKSKKASQSIRKNLLQLIRCLRIYDKYLQFSILNTDYVLRSLPTANLETVQLCGHLLSHCASHGKNHLWKRCTSLIVVFLGDVRFEEILSHRERNVFSSKYSIV